MSETSPSWGTPYTEHAARWLLLGSGELGREVALEAARLGIEVVACDRYANAPAMQVAHHAEVFDMLDGEALRAVVERWRPAAIVPEVEAIATETLEALEAEGWRVVPTARATRLTMDREGIRRLAAEQLGLPTSPYRFASTLAEVEAAAAALGFPLLIKPVMSSSGKGQSTVRSAEELAPAWAYACDAGRGKSQRVIVEGFVTFEREITLLTLRTAQGETLFCPPIGHVQEAGDYRESWQPEPMEPALWAAACEVARAITDALGGCGIFGVELFLCGDEVIFSEVSPRPHDTGMVTLATQSLSEFALHVLAVAGLPVPEIRLVSPGASAVVLATAPGQGPRYRGMEAALQEAGTALRLFGKPSAHAGRRMGVALAQASTVDEARAKARRAAAAIEILVDPT